MKISQKNKGIISIIGSCLLYLPVGSTYILGNINIYVCSYFKNVTSDETSVVFPITTIVGNTVVILSLYIQALIGYRKMLLLATLLTFLFIFFSTYCTNFWLFFVLFGVGYGGTTGFLYVNLMYNAYKYFPTRRGLIGGILMGVYGISSLISNYILLYLMNPDNVKAVKNPSTGDYYFPEEIADRLPESLRVLSYYFLGVMILGNFLQFEYQPEESASGEGLSNKELPHRNLSINSSKDEPLLPHNPQNTQNTAYTSLKQVFSERKVYFIMLMAYCSIQNGYFMASNFKNYGIMKISDDNFLTLVGSLSCVCNGGGRFFWGTISDRLKFKKVYLTILILQMLDIATLRFISSDKPCYLIWVCLALLCEGGHFVIFPPLNLESFGTELGAKVHNVVLMVIACANVTQFALNLGLRGMLGFENEFYIFLGLTFVAFLTCLKFENSVENSNK